jgi:uncharacterized membrane protein
MKASMRNRLLVILVIVLVAGVAVVVAYNVGVGHTAGATFIGPFARGGRGFMMAGGFGWFGLLGPLVLIGLFVGLLVLVLRSAASSAQRPQPGPDPVDKLKELADLHAAGSLSDEEFAAAKRRLLGL